MQHPNIIPLIAALTLLASGCTGLTGTDDIALYGDGTGGTREPGKIVQAGSSTVLPLAEVWAEDFGLARGIDFSVAGGGSGKGASGICNGELDLGDMSRVIKESEISECRRNGVEPIQWPIAFDGLSVVVSKDNDLVKDLSLEQLKSIFIGEGFARTWDEVDPRFDPEPIRLCYPDGDSGTYEYFNEEILGDDFATVGPRTGAGVQQSSDDNVLVQCIKGDEHAIGYFGYAYYIENTDEVDLVAVEGTRPSPETVADGSYTPLSRPIFITTNGVPEGILADYFHYVYHPQGGQALVAEVGYVPLDEDTRQKWTEQLDG